MTIALPATAAALLLIATHPSAASINLYGNLDYDGSWIEVTTQDSAQFDLMWEMDGIDDARTFDFEVTDDSDTAFGSTPLSPPSFYGETISYAYYDPPADHSIFRDDSSQSFSLPIGDYYYRLKAHSLSDDTDWISTNNKGTNPDHPYARLRALKDMYYPVIMSLNPDELTAAQGNTVEKGDSVTFELIVSDDTVLNMATVTANGDYAGSIGLRVTDASHPSGTNKVWPSEGGPHTHYFSYTTPSKGPAAPIDFVFKVCDIVNRCVDETLQIDVIRSLGGDGGEGKNCVLGKSGDSCNGHGDCCSNKCKGNGTCK